MAGARHALGGFDGEEGLARACAAVDEDARGVVEDVEDDALLLGELVELLADVVEEGVGGGDEVEVASEVVGDGVDGVGLERGAFFAGLRGLYHEGYVPRHHAQRATFMTCLVRLGETDASLAQELVPECLGLESGKLRADAGMVARTERREHALALFILAPRRRETQRVNWSGSAKLSGSRKATLNRTPTRVPAGNPVTHEVHLPQCGPRNAGCHRVEA